MTFNKSTYYDHALRANDGKIKYLPTFDYLQNFKTSKLLLKHLLDNQIVFNYSPKDVFVTREHGIFYIIDGTGLLESIRMDKDFHVTSRSKINRRITSITSRITSKDFAAAQTMNSLKVEDRIDVSGVITDIELINTGHRGQSRSYYNINVFDAKQNITFYISPPKDAKTLLERLDILGFKNMPVKFNGKVKKKYAKSVKLTYAQDFEFDPVEVAMLAIQS